MLKYQTDLKEWSKRNRNDIWAYNYFAANFENPKHPDKILS